MLCIRRLESHCMNNTDYKKMGFSFVYQILGQESNINFLRDHIFYQSLRGEEINLDRFAGALEALSEDKLNSMIANIPEEWNNDKISKIVDHINGIRNNVNEFIDEVRRALQ